MGRTLDWLFAMLMQAEENYRGGWEGLWLGVEREREREREFVLCVCVLVLVLV